MEGESFLEGGAPQEDRNLVGVNFIILGFAAMDRFQVEGLAKDKGDVFLGAEGGQPIPRANTFDADDQGPARWGIGFQERFRSSHHVPMQHDISLLIENAEIPRTSVQVDAAVKSVLVGVESHEVASILSRPQLIGRGSLLKRKWDRSWTR